MSPAALVPAIAAPIERSLLTQSTVDAYVATVIELWRL
jgi:hypothetical protein